MVEGRPAPGWYPDPGGTSARRYWDGAQWTGHLEPAQPPAGQAAPVQPTPDQPAPAEPSPQQVAPAQPSPRQVSSEAPLSRWAVMPSKGDLIWVIAIVAVTVALGTLYFLGTFDTLLVNAGIDLNAKPCLTADHSGETFCGDDLKEACENERGFQQGNPDACSAVGVDSDPDPHPAG
ncbi:MAG TPA: DUF2510 domain-containing protein [Solirubrobacterales bacterium]|nr:DUF2510 domain-containing protein [Solirubrobacterales bacterium]